MPGIRTNAAAEVLGVSPNTLRSWERRYGYPVPKRTVGNHRNYELVELQTLRDALAETGNISSAIELARQRQAAPANGGSLTRRLRELRRGRRRPARSRKAWRCDRWSAPSRRCCCRRSTSSPPTPSREAELEFASRWATGLAARRPPPRLRRLAPGRDPAARLQPRPGRRGGPRPGARPRPASRRLPRPRPLQRARRRAPRARPRRPRPDRDRDLRPRRRHPRRGRADPQDPRARLRGAALRVPRQRLDRRRRPPRRRVPERGHRRCSTPTSAAAPPRRSPSPAGLLANRPTYRWAKTPIKNRREAKPCAGRREPTAPGSWRLLALRAKLLL